MTRVSLARSLQIALLGLAMTLAVIAAFGVAGLYGSRQDYEDALASAYELEAAGARLLAAAVVEEAALRPGHSLGTRRRAAAAFSRTARAARALAASDAPSARLVLAIAAAQRRARRNARDGRERAAARQLTAVRRLSDRLAVRQLVRRRAAADRARAASRRTLTLAAGAGALALAAAGALVVGLIGAVRTPLAALVSATQRLAGGRLAERVRPAGPRELVGLAESFNTMAAELERARERIESERRRLSVTIESLADALVVCDADGRVEEVNPRARELVPELTPGEASVGGDSPLPEPERALDAEVQVEHRGRTLSVVASRLGGGDGLVWTVRDATERARLERLKSEFVATASHELRSPLTSIKGFVELLRGEADLDSRQREFVDIILVSTNRLVDLVNDLLDVARVEAGAVRVHPRPLDLGPLVREVATLMGPRLEERRHRLELDVPQGLPAAMADPSRVRQILTNLVTNAHLYTSTGGRLGVRLSAADGQVRLEVWDTGRGMTAEQLEHVFDRFYRVRSADSAPGTGLGLSIVRSLVDLHHGQIDVASRLGEGTTFTVSLPAAARRADLAARRAALAGRRVLVVDDEPQIARLIGAQLAEFDVETVLVHNGDAALEALRANGFDAVTLDVLMPGRSGLDVLRAIRDDPGCGHVPVVVVSVFSGEGALAGESVVSKPIDADELAGALASAVTRGRSRVVVVARSPAREAVQAALADSGVSCEWAEQVEEVSKLCAEHRFEVAMVDAGLEDPGAAVAALDLRGRRSGHAVLLFSLGPESDAEIDGAGARPLPLEDAVAAALTRLAPTGRQ